jgi:hypothetical protein
MASIPVIQVLGSRTVCVCEHDSHRLRAFHLAARGMSGITFLRTLFTVRYDNMTRAMHQVKFPDVVHDAVAPIWCVQERTQLIVRVRV